MANEMNPQEPDDRDDPFRPPTSQVPPAMPVAPPVAPPAVPQSGLTPPPPPPPAPPAFSGPGGTVPVPGGMGTPDVAVASVSTGVLEPATSTRSRWMGRGLAVGAAALLMGGGGYLAINAASADGGAESPSGALDGVLSSLSDEDFIGAAEFVEPAERETMVDAGFDVIEELVRLEVFGDDLDLSAVDGIDLDFSDVVIRSEQIRPGLAHLFVDGGNFSGAFDGGEVPFGSLVTDRVDQETLDVETTESSAMEPTDTPIVAVERDGRWYLSLWYTVAENARLELGQPLPDPALRPVAIGGDSPEDAIERMVAAAVEVDLAAMIGLMDPEEAAALYDYAPLFLDDGQSVADELLNEARLEGWQWSVDSLELSSTRDGRLASVVVDGMSLRATGPDGRFEMDYSGNASTIVFEGDGIEVEIVSDLDCVTTTIDDGYGAQTDQFCTSDLESVGGFDMLTTGAFANLQQLPAPGVVVREVGGRWYVSPLRTGSQLMIDALRNIEPDALAETVDALAEFAQDPFGINSGALDGTFGEAWADDFGDDWDDDFGQDEFPQFDTVDPPLFEEVDPFIDEIEDLPPVPANNIDLLSPEIEWFWSNDIEGIYAEDAWAFFSDVAEPRPFDRGVWVDGGSPDTDYSVIVLSGSPFASVEELAAYAGGDVVVDGDRSYVRGTSSWGGDYAAAPSGDGVAIVGLWGPWDEAILEILWTQVGS